MVSIHDLSVKAVRSVLFLFNLFFALTGLILLTIGVMIKGVFTEYEPFLDDRYLSASSLLITSGSLIFVIAFFGCCGALKENRCMVLTYSVLLTAIMIVEFAGGVTGYALSSQTSEMLDYNLNKTMYQYNTTKDVAILWDTIQSEFHCCGLHNATDWEAVFKQPSIPVSCCKFPYGAVDNITCSASSENLYHTSCKDKMYAEVIENTNLLGGVAFSIIGLQFLGILFSCYLAKSIKNANYETV